MLKKMNKNDEKNDDNDGMRKNWNRKAPNIINGFWECWKSQNYFETRSANENIFQAMGLLRGKTAQEKDSKTNKIIQLVLYYKEIENK